ncbi:calcium-binding protein [Hyphococcus sp.]|uniref:calcium-binding protein n=1 Tax=Hyphococcus sp. TaxID=2038636 RepID=UPI003CCC44D4
MPAPVEWLSPFQVNTGAAANGTQGAPIIIGLANGNILTAWAESASGAVGTGEGVDIIAKIYDLNGAVVRDAYQLNFDRFVDDEFVFDVAATSDGGFILTYVDHDIADTDETEIYWERFDDAGDQVAGDSLAIETTADENLTNPQLAVDLSDDSFVVTFSYENASDVNIRGVRVDSSGVAGTGFDAAQNSVDFDGEGDLAVLSNGNFVSVYEEDDAGVPGIEFVIFDNSGVLVKADTPVSTGENVLPQVASLADGGFVVTWVAEDAGNNDIQFSIYEADGTLRAGAFSLAGTTDNENEPELAALPNGQFVILWDNDTDGTLEGRLLNPNGTADGGVFIIESPGTTQPNVGVTGDGRILFTWLSDDGAGEVFASIWDPRENPVNFSDYEGDRNFVASNGYVTPLTVASEINGSDLRDTITGTAFDDTLYGFSFSDQITGLDGNDTIAGGFANDSVFGGAGNDTFLIFDGEFIDDVYGGAGRDTVDISDETTNGVDADLEAGTWTGLGGTLDLVGVENIIATQAGDSIGGSAADNTLLGGGGGDLLSGLGGVDVIDGGADNDTISGGFGDDTLNGGAGDDTIGGDAGRDSIIGGDGADTLHGFGSHDTLLGGDGNDDLRGGFGRDLIGGSAGNDVGRGFEGEDRLFGGGGNDTLVGNDGDDSLTGGGGVDRLRGDAGDDTLNGRFGDDSVTGGAGDDLFQFRQGHANDVYDDFVAGAGTDDVIQLVAFGAAFDTFAEVIAAASDNGNHTTIDFGGGDSILLLNVTVADLHEDDFIFT